MNPGIFYLYEYENNKRKRNVGFIKIVRRYQTCIFQIHVRGISVDNGASLELYAFYRDGNAMTAAQIATLTCFGKTISERLPISERSFPEGRPLSEMDGFLIKLPGDKTTVFWMASAFFFPVDISQLRPPAAPKEGTEITPAPAPEEGTEITPAPAPDNEKTEEPGPDAGNDETEESAPSPGSSEPSSLSEGISGQEREPDTAGAESGKSKKKARKIQRSDISVLPRRFWFLANNSFLLHGYHNYNHLLLAEEDGRLWLGVPGIYDLREAKVADLFGFPQFTRDYTDCLELEPEERSDSADFGYWCRCVGNGRI